jgi:indole-3-glycerol phosphate synthase
LKTILDEIIEIKKEEVKTLRRDFTFSRFKDSTFYEKSNLSFLENLNTNERIAIIAEIKKASPSKGIIREDFNHLMIADLYLENEVDAISVLTDKNFFKGDIKYLNEIAQIKTAPLLRKDFIIDEIQIYEAKSNGADIILLIAEALSDKQIQELTHAAYENNLEVLLELHSEDQIEKINFNFNTLIGINNRDLNTFNVSLETTINLSQKLPPNIKLVSESGINTEDDLNKLKSSRTNAILIGEHFMRSENTGESIKKMKEWCIRES